MGFIEETGAAQTLRDVRITTIYEGTTGIQSNDLIGRKVGRDRGASLLAFIAEMEQSLKAETTDTPQVARTREAAADAVARLRSASEALLQHLATAPDRAMAVSVPFLKLCGTVMGGWLLARSASIATRRLANGASDREFLLAKLATAEFYATQVLPQALALEAIVKQGSDAVVGTDVALI
jgi:hypothetical protein